MPKRETRPVGGFLIFKLEEEEKPPLFLLLPADYAEITVL
jgi:hypothetical protein